MNDEPEIFAHEQALREAERFGRMLAESEREEDPDLEDLLQLEYGGDDEVLHASGEEDAVWADLFAWLRPETGTPKQRNP